MQKTLEFPDRLRLIAERSAAFRALVASAPTLDVPVPTCPGWTLFDLAQHVGLGRRKAAAVVAAGPADAPPDPSAWQRDKGAPREREALLAWLAESIELLAGTLREAGPDRGCWTWWDTSQSPQTTGAVARHQIHEVAVHTYDAQLTLGAPQPLPDELALDGVEEFQLTCCATTVPWPHEPAVADYHTTEGPSWRLRLSAAGARITRLPTSAADEEPNAAAKKPTAAANKPNAAAEKPNAVGKKPDPADEKPDASAEGTASDLVLVFYGRLPLDSLKVDGDRRIFERLIDWDPDA